MANNLLTIDMITRKALMILENKLVITRNCNRQYDSSFAVNGAKIGSTLRIRKPNRYLVSSGAALQVQDTNEQSTTLTVSSQRHVDTNFTTAELTLSLDDFAQIILEPAMSQLASQIDADVANAYQSIYNMVGTPGLTPSTMDVLLEGQEILDNYAAPRDDRYMAINPAANRGLINGLKGLLNPAAILTDQYKKGILYKDQLGYNEIGMTQSIQQHLTGTRIATGLTVGTSVSAQGQAYIAITGDSGSATINKGDVFTVAGCYQVNPQTRTSTGSLQQFVATDTVIASGGTWSQVPVSPSIYTASQQLATVDSFPQSGAAVVFVGAPTSQYAQNLIYHKDAITFATADLLLPGGVDMASRQVYNGISMRIVRQYDINNDRLPCRIDVLYGYGVIRPETACRLIGA